MGPQWVYLVGRASPETEWGGSPITCNQGASIWSGDDISERIWYFPSTLVFITLCSTKVNASTSKSP